MDHSAPTDTWMSAGRTPLSASSSPHQPVGQALLGDGFWVKTASC